jgi:hypothetical protein
VSLLQDPYLIVQTTLAERRREADQQRLLDQLPRTRVGLRSVLAQVLLRLARLIDDRPTNLAPATSCPSAAVLV